MRDDDFYNLSDRVAKLESELARLRAKIEAPPPKKEKKVRVTLRMPLSLIRWIDKMAKREGLSRSAFVEKVLRSYFNESRS